MSMHQGENARPMAGPAAIGILLGALGVAIHQTIVTLMPVLLMLACILAFVIAILACIGYARLPVPPRKRLWVALLGGVVNVLVALLVWFSLRLGLDEAVATILAGPAEILATMDLMGLMISFSLSGQTISGSVLVYAFWLPELVLLFLFPLLLSRLDLNDLH